MSKRFILILTVFFLSFSINSQVSVNAGTGFSSGFTSDNPGVFLGFHLGAEVPRNNDVTFYGRISHFLARKESTSFSTYAEAIDLTTSPYTILVDYTSSTNYTSIEGGTRYYLGNGFDNGFSVYGGSNMALLFYGVKRNYDDFAHILSYYCCHKLFNMFTMLSKDYPNGKDLEMPCDDVIERVPESIFSVEVLDFITWNHRRRYKII